MDDYHEYLDTPLPHVPLSEERRMGMLLGKWLRGVIANPRIGSVTTGVVESRMERSPRELWKLCDRVVNRDYLRLRRYPPTGVFEAIDALGDPDRGSEVLTGCAQFYWRHKHGAAQ